MKSFYCAVFQFVRLYPDTKLRDHLAVPVVASQ